MRPRRLVLVLTVCCIALAAVGASGAQAAKHKRAPKTYVYGICGKDVCRVDVATRKAKRIAKHHGATAYGGVAASPSGRATALAYGGHVFRAARDGKRRHRLDSDGASRPFITDNGRSVGWVQRSSRYGCEIAYPYPACGVHTYYSAAVQSATEAKSTLYGYDVITASFYRNQLMAQAAPPGVAVEQADYICTVADHEGHCARTLAADPTRALSSPAMSPNGRYLAVVSEPKPPPNGTQRFKGRIEIYSPASGRRIRTLTTGSDDDTPIFSPDSERVAFQHGRDVVARSVRGGRSKLIGRKLTLTGPSWARGK